MGTDPFGDILSHTKVSQNWVIQTIQTWGTREFWKIPELSPTEKEFLALTNQISESTGGLGIGGVETGGQVITTLGKAPNALKIAIGAQNATKASSHVLLNSTKQLQAKFKHAADFGITGPANKANLSKFSSALNQHVNSPQVKTIQGTYRGNPVTHYIDPATGLNVISSSTGNFISGWKLNPAQLQNILN